MGYEQQLSGAGERNNLNEVIITPEELEANEQAHHYDPTGKKAREHRQAEEGYKQEISHLQTRISLLEQNIKNNPSFKENDETKLAQSRGDLALAQANLDRASEAAKKAEEAIVPEDVIIPVDWKAEEGGK